MNLGKPIVAKTPKSKSQKKSGNFFSKGTFIQPKLTIGPSDDQYEREADMIAERVVSTPENHFIQPKISPIAIHRKCAKCEEEEKKMIQPKSRSSANIEAHSEINAALNTGGKPLESSTRSFMESRFGYDFSNVQIHTGQVAAKSANSINALAYTSGHDIVFNEGQYAPGTESGKKLLAHELTHVVQQDKAVQPELIQRAAFVCDEYRSVPRTSYNPGPGINLSISGHAVTISANLEVYGNGATKARANSIKSTIERIWSASFTDGYSVNTSVNIQVRGATEDSSRTQINIIEGGGMSFTTRYWIVGSRYIEYYTGSDINWTPAHEFGHLLGLDDHYSEGVLSRLGGLIFNADRSTEVESGWEGNLMAVHGGVLEKKNLEELERIGFAPSYECARGHMESPI